MRLANKTALITGGNSGIGLATARLFVKEGARVVITGRNQATLEAAAKELGPNALAIVADATDIAATEAAIKQGAEKFGKLDIVFANAGIAGGTPLGSSTVEAFQKVISTNLVSVFFTVQSALPYLNDNASIILNGSVISVLGIPGYSAYGAAKAGVAIDGADHGIGVVAARHPRQRRCAWRNPHSDLGALPSQRPKPRRHSKSGSACRRRSAALVNPITFRRRCCSSRRTIPPTSRGRNYSSTAVRRLPRQARRSIEDNQPDMIETGLRLPTDTLHRFAGRSFRSGRHI